MNHIRWRTLILGLCATGAIFAVLNLIDVLGIGTAPPWLGAGPPIIGRWGAYFGDSGKPYQLKVVSVDPNGPAERADLEPGDLVDLRGNQFWKLYLPPNGQVVDLDVFRQNSPIPVLQTQLVTGPPLSLYSWILSDCGSVLLLILAIYFVRRKQSSARDLTFAAVLALLSVGILTRSTSFGTPWWWSYPVLGIFNLTLPASVAVWARFASYFGEPSPRRRYLEQACYAVVALALLIEILKHLGATTLWFSPVPLAFATYAILPVATAISLALLCNILAAISIRGSQRKELFWLTLPVASIYFFALANTITARLSQSYGASHILFVIETFIILIAPLTLISMGTPQLFQNAWRTLGRPLTIAGQWIVGQPNFKTFASIAGVITIGLFVFIRATASQAIVISDINVPKDLADRGFSPDTESLRLRDDLNQYVKDAKSKMRADKLYLSSEDPAAVPVVIPGVGAWVASMADWLATLAGSHRDFSGEFTEADNGLALRLRLGDQEIFDAQEPARRQSSREDAANDLLGAAPSCVLMNADPYLVAAHLYYEEADGDQYPTFTKARDKAMAIIAVLKDDDPNVIFSHLLLATIDANPPPGNEDAVAHDIDAAKPYGNGEVEHTWRGKFFLVDYLVNAERLAAAQQNSKKADGRNGIKQRHEATSPKDRPKHSVAIDACRPRSYDERLVDYYSEGTKNRGNDSLSCLIEDKYHILYELNWALNLDPNYGVAHEGLGLFYWQLAAARKSEKNRQEAYLQAREYGQAAAQLNAAIESEPHNPSYLGELGEIYKFSWKYDKAAAQLSAAVRSDPHNPLYLEQLGEIHMLIGEMHQKESHYGTALSAYQSALSQYGSLVQVPSYRPNDQLEADLDRLRADLEVLKKHGSQLRNKARGRWIQAEVTRQFPSINRLESRKPTAQAPAPEPTVVPHCEELSKFLSP